MPDEGVQFIVGFVEGRVSPREFELRLQNDPALEATLTDDPELPRNTYVGSSVYLFLLEEDLRDPRGVLNAQGALSEWLKRHSVAHRVAAEPKELYDLLLFAQPKWLDVDTKYLQEAFLNRSEGRTGQALRKWLHQELLSKFRYVSKPPEWIQSPQWPVGANGPLVFLGQVEIEKYFHDLAAAYVFHDLENGECTTVIQVA